MYFSDLAISSTEEPTLKAALQPGETKEIMSFYGSESGRARNLEPGWPEDVAIPDTNAHADELEVLRVRLDVEPKEVWTSEKLLSIPERQRASRFVHDRDSRRFIVARARLRQLLASRLGTRPESVELAYGAHGKPALAGPRATLDLRFNVSHSGDIAVFAFSRRREVGVDVEAVRAISDADQIAARFFSQVENEAYLALDQRDKPIGFFNCWTRKEAFIKAIGKGLYHPLDRFDVSLAPGEPARILRVENVPGEDCGWSIYSFTVCPGFVGSVVLEKIDGRHSSSAVLEHTAHPLVPANGFSFHA